MTAPALVSTDWLADHLARVVVVDGSSYLPTSGRDAAAEHAAGHLPGAVFLDLEASSDPTSPLPHMLLPPDRFAARMSALGIGDGDHVVDLPLIYSPLLLKLPVLTASKSLRRSRQAGAARMDAG